MSMPSGRQRLMAMFGSARERTLEELTELLHGAGFGCAGVIRTASPVLIVQARPARLAGEGSAP